MLEAVILGIIQGLTEFFPVSSTAHLVLVPWFMNWSGQVSTLAFDVALHGGTLLALLLYFWRDWLSMLTSRRRLLGLVLLATVPAGIVGVSLEGLVETTLRGPLVIAFSLVVFGLYMLWAERFPQKRKLSDVNFIDALVIGLSQAVAVVPGVSRSGITISTGLMRNLNREDAARFSFFLSGPVIGGAFVLEMKDILTGPSQWDMGPLVAGFVAAFLSGLFAIRFLLWFFRRFPLNVFVYYRVVIAVIIVITWLQG